MITNEEYLKHIDKIIDCHLCLSGLGGLKYNLSSKGGKLERAAMNNIIQISQHAGEKRFSMGEIFDRSNLLALCQYEFMMKKMLPFIHEDILKTAVTIAITKIERVRELFGCPCFKNDENTVVVVEVISEGKLIPILPEELAVWTGKFKRLLPINREQLKAINNENEQLLNWNGDESETVVYILGV